MTHENGARGDAGRFVHVTRLLRRYPDISADELEDLKAWFKSEASALDVGLLASNEEITNGYALFRKEHIDRYDGRELVVAAVFVLAIIAAVALAAHLAM